MRNLFAYCAGQAHASLTCSEDARSGDDDEDPLHVEFLSGGVSLKDTRLRALGRGYLDFAIHHREQLRLMFGGEIADMREFPELMDAAHDAFAAISTAVERYLSEGNTGPTGRMGPQTATIAAWSMVHGLSTLLIDHKADPAETEAGTEAELIEQILDIFVDALKKPG